MDPVILEDPDPVEYRPDPDPLMLQKCVDNEFFFWFPGVDLSLERSRSRKLSARDLEKKVNSLEHSNQ